MQLSPLESSQSSSGRGRFPCNQCGKTFAHRPSLSRHRLKHQGTIFVCGDCGEQFTQATSWHRHSKQKRHTSPQVRMRVIPNKGLATMASPSLPYLSPTLTSTSLPISPSMPSQSLASTIRSSPLTQSFHENDDKKKDISSRPIQDSIAQQSADFAETYQPLAEFTLPPFPELTFISALPTSKIDEALAVPFVQPPSLNVSSPWVSSPEQSFGELTPFSNPDLPYTAWEEFNSSISKSSAS